MYLDGSDDSESDDDSSDYDEFASESDDDIFEEAEMKKSKKMHLQILQELEVVLISIQQVYL